MKKGDRKAAAAIYDELAPKVYGFIFTRTSSKEVAEDLTQELFIKLIEKIDGFDEERGRFTVWFWAVTRHMLIDFYREKKATPFSSFTEDAVEGMMIDAGAPNIDDKFRYEKLKDFLKTLSGDERELFELRYVAEVPYTEIAAMLGKSEGSLRVAVLRIKGKIRKEFKDGI